MSRKDDCVEAMHVHVGVCQRRGYANGRADALDEVVPRVAALIDLWESMAGRPNGAYGSCARDLRGLLAALA